MASDAKTALAATRAAVAALRLAVEAGGAGSVGRVLRLAFDAGLAEADPRWSAYLDPDAESPEREVGVLDALMAVDVSEIPRYFEYIATQMPYSTQHGTKGAEYPRVLLILDDNEGNMPGY